MRTRSGPILLAAGLAAALSVTACAERVGDPPTGAHPHAAAAASTPARPTLAKDLRLAFVHTANVVGELEPCG